MPLLLAYSFRNLRVRTVTTLLTAGGMAFVVFVYAAVLMLDAGLRQTMASTGDGANVIFVRRSAEVEIQSLVDRQQAAILASEPEVMIGAEGLPLVSNEVVVMVSLPKSGTTQTRSILARGVGPDVLMVRPQVRISEGRMLRPGSNEIVIGGRLQGVELGSYLTFAKREWRIVGRFDAGGSGFDSEIWGDGDQFMQAFRRNIFSSVVARLADSSGFDRLKARVESNPRLSVDAIRERTFYEGQSRMFFALIRVFGITLSLLFSLGAIIGAAITMYAAVASRRREIGALRALGFRRSGILVAFLAEAILIGLAGWAAGLAFASSMTMLRLTILSGATFSELAFQFVLTPGIVFQTLVFAILMGGIGGFLPAVRAARMKIVDSLRAV